MFPVSLPIRLLGQLGYKNLDFLKRMFPHLQQRKFTRIDDFYELLICCQTYIKMLANGAMKLLLCQRLMGIGNFQPKKEHYYLMTIINRIYRVLNPLPNSGSLVPRLITSRSFNRYWVTSIKFHEIYPIMAVASSSCHIWRIKSDNTFELVSSLQNSTINSFNSVAFHPKLPFLATGLSSGIVMLVKFNIDGKNSQILNTKTINKGIIWSIVFHPNLPIVYVSNDYGYLMVLQFSPDFRTLLSESLLRPHNATINGIAIQRNGRFLATCSDDYTAKISIFESADCKQLRTFATFSSFRKILCINIHPTLDLVVIGSDDQYAKIWQINEDFTTTFIKSFYHPSGVRCVQFEPYNLTLITGCYDGHVRIWNFEGTQIHKFRKPTSSYSSVLAIGFSPNIPRILAIGDGDEVTISKLEEPKDSKN
jgi:WD40 repeat protein